MAELWTQLSALFAGGPLAGVDLLKIVVQILIIGYALIWTWRRIRGTHAERLVKGMMFIAMLWIVSALCGLTIITTVLREMVPVLIIAIIIVFQPELRRGLGYLGRSRFKVDFSLTDTQSEQTQDVINQIIKAVSDLSRSKTGALIVVEPPDGERDYVSPGTTLNAEVSASLLLSIFNPTSPLHDGAVVIRQNKIIAAGVILPVTDNPKLSQRYGTRHRAALGLSELYDGLCIVASEETGAISAANRGMLVRYNSAEELNDALLYVYHQGPEPIVRDRTTVNALMEIFKKHKGRHHEADNAHPRRRATDFPEDQALDKAIKADSISNKTRQPADESDAQTAESA